MRFDFLIASERSGSNLMVRILNSHSKVCGPAPTHLIRTFVWNRKNYGNLSIDANWMALITDVSALLGNQLGKWKTVWPAKKLEKSVSERRLAAVIKTVYEAEASTMGKQRLFVKENQAALLAPFIMRSFPEARFLHLVRDPRDMALSWKLSPNHPGGVMRGSRVWHEDQIQAQFVCGGLYSAERVMTVRYEDLLAFPGKILRKICGFLDLTFEENMLEFYSDRLTRENAGRLKDWANLARPIMADNYTKYKKNLSEPENQWIESICGHGMKHYGYITEFPLTVPHEALERQLGELENNFTREKTEKTTVALDSEEKQIRQKRLDVIRRIVNRRPVAC
jgi:hypothetical protein